MSHQKCVLGSACASLYPLAGSKGQILHWLTAKCWLYVLAGLFCASDLLNRGRFCMCVQEVDSQGELPVVCTVLCSSHPYPGCMSGGFRRNKKWEVIQSLATSMGWSLVFASRRHSWALWHQVSKEARDRCQHCIPGPLLQGADGPACKTEWGGAPVPSPGADTVLFAEWDLPVV